ncbi:hypothetical protein [Arthrobacter alpinus]|uniref:hypothetical protein n=1 Tax=Arthrobacter alpinus TaxID=656366 RepID=UPI0037BEF173
MARRLGPIDTYPAPSDADGLQLHQFANANFAAEIGSSAVAGTEPSTVAITVQTQYSKPGDVKVTDSPAEPWTLSVRVSDWAEGATVSVSGHVQPVEPGYAKITQVFKPGTVTLVQLPLIPRVLSADSRIDAIRGYVAVQQGPRVYFLESFNLPADRHVDGCVMDPGTAPVLDGRRLLLQCRLSHGERAACP